MFDPMIQTEPLSGKLSEIAYAKIVELIGSGTYPVNARLPTENALSAQLAVSRPIVREALARLREDGVVVSRRGSGTYVRAIQGARSRQLGPVSSIEDMRHCLIFRRGLEAESAYFAALGAPGDDRLDIAFARLEASIGNSIIPLDEDFAFHLAIAQRTGNRYYESTINALKESVASSMNISRSFLMPQGAARVRDVHGEHVAVYRAIKAGDAPGARDAMCRHIDNVIARAFGSSGR